MSPRQLPRPGNRFAGLPIRFVVNAEQAMHALERGDGAQALRELDRTRPDGDEHAEVLRLRGLALMQLGQFAAALHCLAEACERWPDDALIACQFGAAQAQNGDMAAAEASFERAVALDASLVDAWYNLGHARDLRADTAGACAAFERALRAQPGYLAARVRRADMLKMLGRLDEAERELRTVLAQDPDSIPAWVGLAHLKTFRPSPDELEHLLRLLSENRVPESQRVDFMFACASFLEAQQRYAQAYPLFVAANAEKRRHVRWNAAAVSGLVDRILDRFGRLPPPQGDARRGAEAIFLVGMPRSGSTLAEQILSAHPQVQGGGERNEIVELLQAESARRGQHFPDWVTAASEDDWARLGEDYLQRCAAWRDARPRFSNKTLTNWQTLGAIRRMLPGARIIHCRRDPLETLWSCYKHHFGDAQFFTYDMDELVAYWRDCERSMQAWSSLWPGWIHPFIHENLLRDPQAAIGDLLAFCDLPFDPACVAFHENPRDVRTTSAAQVRQPLRNDLAVAGKYGELLDSLRRSTRSIRPGTVISD